MLTVAAVLMASCSDDDQPINSNSTTVGFASEKITVKENAGYINVPIEIAGVRNGDIKLTVAAEPVGSNPAVEDTHYLITGKTLTLLNDTTKTATLNVQIKTVDDAEINDPREFKLKITSVEGGQLQRSEVNIVLRDNDAAFYEKFFGKWKLTGKNYKGNAVSYDVTISGAGDEDDPDYDNRLYVTISKIISGLDASTYLYYTFDKNTRTGTLSFDMMNTSDPLAFYEGYNTKWCWVNFNLVDDLLNDPIDAEWKVEEDGGISTTINFDTHGGSLAYYEYFSGNDDYAGLWGYYTDLVLKK